MRQPVSERNVVGYANQASQMHEDSALLMTVSLILSLHTNLIGT